MSYDLVAFDPAVAPRERGAFTAWFQAEPLSSGGWEKLPPALASFFAAIRPHYRSLNGPDVIDDDADFSLTADYSFSSAMIYGCFAWSKAEEVYPLFRQLASDNDVGFYDVSGDEGDGEIFFPGDSLRPPSNGAWRQVAADFRSGDLNKYVNEVEQPKRRWFDFFRRPK